MAMRSVDVAERRRRLGRRHALARSARAASVQQAAEQVVCLHATDPVGLHLSVAARVDGYDVGDLDRALHEERSVVRLVAMRRTVWTVPAALVPHARAGAGERVARTERNRLVSDVEKAGLHVDGRRWLEDAQQAVLDLLADGRPRTAAEIRAERPLLEGAISFGEGRTWAGVAPVAPRVLTALWAAGAVLRVGDDGPWYVSRPRWGLAEHWLGAPIDALTEADAVTVLVRRWLERFGPGTEADITWWLGGRVTEVRRSLADLGAVAMGLDGETGFVLPDDVDEEPALEPWTALLGPLDPTTMGWKGRAWYLGAHKARLFDTAGNAGPTMWSDGRIVGGWAQDPHGVVVLQPLEDIGAEAQASFERQAGELTTWFGGARRLMRFPSPLARELLGPR
jgi:hypothetical protein